MDVREKKSDQSIYKMICGDARLFSQKRECKWTMQQQQQQQPHESFK